MSDQFNVFMTEIDRINDRINALSKNAKKRDHILKQVKTMTKEILHVVNATANKPNNLDEQEVIDTFISSNYVKSNLPYHRIKRNPIWLAYKIFAKSYKMLIPSQKKLYETMDREFGKSRRLTFPDGQKTMGYKYTKEL